jgi:hypothetical protein
MQKCLWNIIISGVLFNDAANEIIMFCNRFLDRNGRLHKHTYLLEHRTLLRSQCFFSCSRGFSK